MYKKSEIFYIKTITPTHMGSGSDLGIVDLPIQRESHTGFPKIEGSSLKGSIREAVEQNNADEIKVHQVFGYDETNASNNAKETFKDNKDKFAGAIGFSDARVLLFPVKSVKGVFAYVTCPMVIERFINDLNIADIKVDFTKPQENKITKNSSIKLEDEEVVILEEYSFEISSNDENVEKFANFLRNKLNIDTSKLIVLSNDDFKDFVKMFTEVITRTKIDNSKGIVQEGALFTEEYLPAETVMYSLAMVSPIFAKLKESDINNEDDVLKFFKDGCSDVIQIGGNATIGKGICEIIKKKDNSYKGNKNEQK